MTQRIVSQTSTPGKVITYNRVIWAGAVAAIIATAANLAVYFLVPALFNFTLEFPLQGPGSEVQRLPAVMVVIATILGASGATILFTVLNRVTARVVPVFRVIAVVALLLSFGAPFSLVAPLRVPLTLATMHITAAVVIVYILTRQTS